MAWTNCPHKKVREEAGEPILGPYFVCLTCGKVFNSEIDWLREQKDN